jgi:hypothetical protein
MDQNQPQQPVQNTNPVSQPNLQQPATEAPKSKSKFKIILLIAAILLAIYGGAYYFVINQLDNFINHSQKPKTTSVSKPTPTPDPTANWKTYKNDKYGFEVEFNPIWRIDYFINNAYLLPEGSGENIAANIETANHIIISGITPVGAKDAATLSISIKEISKDIPLDKISSSISTPTDGSSSSLNKQKIKIDGQNAYDETISFMEICRRTVYLIKEDAKGNSYEYEVDFTRNDLLGPCKKEDLEDPQFDQILSAFKFAN